jgi:preprotein translocase subunit SecE
MSKLQVFFRAYLDELVNKVTWPTLEELQANTITVLVASLIIAIVVALMDAAFNQGMGLLYGMFQ